MNRKLKYTFRHTVKFIPFSLRFSTLLLLLYHIPFFKFVFNNIDYISFNGTAVIISLIVLIQLANFLAVSIVLFILRAVGKYVLALLLIVNSIAIYFITTYSVIIDESMMGNVLNTDYEESGSFFSFKLVVCIVMLGILPGILIIRMEVQRIALKKFLLICGASLLLIMCLVFANASNWLWIDKNSKTLGGLAMPWSYSVNTSLYYIHQSQKNKKEILLPDATIKDKKKSVMVLVIGESARSQNFSLYGYAKNTNPYLAATPNVFHFNANSCATYTTAGVKCILEHTSSDELYEILHNYLYRNKVEVIWRTTNWGEPPVHIKNYLKKADLMQYCSGQQCEYDEILLAGLKEQILASKKDKILVVLHTSTSHGHTYSKNTLPGLRPLNLYATALSLAIVQKRNW